MILSLCMIVKNEAANLARCLSSVEGWVDEMIVLDTGSTDRTVEVAKTLGAQVHHFDWQNDFAAARNASLKYAKGDWILVLDGDETLAEGIIPLLKPVLQGDEIEGISGDDLLLISFVRQEVNARQSPYSLVSRLFRNHPDIRFCRPYHETVDDSVAKLIQREPAWEVISLPKVGICHTGYQPSAIAAQDKFNRAQMIMETFLAEHPNDPYICNKLGALYGQMGNWRKGLELLTRGVQAAQADAMTTYELHYHLGLAYRHLNQLELANTHYLKAMQQPILPQLKLGAYINLGGLLKLQGQLNEAIAIFETATKIAPNFAIAHYNLGLTHRARGYLEPAIAAYQKAIRLQPEYAKAHQNLGAALFKLGKLPESRVAFERAIDLHQTYNPDEAQRLRQGLKKLGLT
ncbi:MAG: tetratricopeptide repeat protein [Pseudanabaenales cyanobacterium]|nr:tetratricopeptide repeat protein [Pseudanabaenales cyanobacterium]